MLLRHSMLLWASRRGFRNLRVESVPVLVELHRTNSTPDSVRDLVVGTFNRKGFQDSSRFVDQALADGRIEVLLDGLDEVNTDQRAQVVQMINDFAESYDSCRVADRANHGPRGLDRH